MRHRSRSGVQNVMALLVVLVVLAAAAGLEVLVFASPISPVDWAVLTAINVVVTAIGLALSLLWKRLTRKRRQYRNTG